MKPGVGTIIAGGLLLLLGAVGIPLIVFLSLFLRDSQGVQFLIPGSVEVSVDQPGRYYLWNDFRTIYDGTTYNRSQRFPDGVQIRVRDADGQALQLVADTHYSVETGDSASNSLGYVEVQRPGRLTIDVSGGDEERILSFSPTNPRRFIGVILGTVLLSGLVAISGFGVVVWGIVQLVKSRRGT